MHATLQVNNSSIPILIKNRIGNLERKDRFTRFATKLHRMTPRDNNAVKWWQNAFARSIFIKHATVQGLIVERQEEQDVNRGVFERLTACENPPRRKNKHRHHDSRLRTIVLIIIKPVSCHKVSAVLKCSVGHFLAATVSDSPKNCPGQFICKIQCLGKLNMK